jgi:hypothetical protein
MSILIFTPDTEEGDETAPKPIRVFFRGIRAVADDGSYMVDVASIDPEMVKYLAHEHELSNDPRYSLNDLMETDHVIEVRESGLILDGPRDVYAPDVYLDATEAPEGWEFLDGYSSQDRYSGPHMHACEYIGGRLEADIRENPGVYVATVVTDLSADTDEGEDDIAGWVALRKL